MGMGYSPVAAPRADRYRARVDEYKFYRHNGYLKVESLLPLEDVQQLFDWANRLREPAPAASGGDGLSLDQIFQQKTRVHQLHRIDATAEWGLLHPRILDVLEAIIGPDVLALQSMLFYNPPGTGGQGWHQDAFYITTYPDTLIGVWIALEPADEENGCLWVAPTSNQEPIYPSAHPHGHVHSEGSFDDLHSVENVSHLDDEINTLSQIAKRYPPPVSVPMNPGDVLFFEGHLLHRSYPNRSQDRWRRAYVCHYCNARSWVPWNHGEAYEGDSANALHILARGSTHLPYAAPAFGTPVTLSEVQTQKGAPARMMGDDSGMMEMG